MAGNQRLTCFTIAFVSGLALACFAQLSDARSPEATAALQDLLNAMGFRSVNASVTPCPQLNASTNGQLDVRCTRFGEPAHIIITKAKMSALPASISAFTSLLSLDVTRSIINGGIPGTIGSFANLSRLVLSSDHLSGVIPPSITSLSKLTILDLSSNKLVGTIPDGITALTNLTILSLGNNQLNGPISPALSALIFLTTLDLEKNLLQGAVPATLGNLPYINAIFLRNNNLTGTIPTELGKPQRLQILSLSGNNLSGTIPYSLGKSAMLSTIDLSWNQLTGTVPTSFLTLRTKFGGGYQLVLSDNYLSGAIPYGLFLAPPYPYDHLYRMDLSGNYFTGPLGDCPPYMSWVARNCLTRSPACGLTNRASQRSGHSCSAFCSAGVWLSPVPACNGTGTCAPAPGGGFACA